MQHFLLLLYLIATNLDFLLSLFKQPCRLEKIQSTGSPSATWEWTTGALQQLPFPRVIAALHQPFYGLCTAAQWTFPREQGLVQFLHSFYAWYVCSIDAVVSEQQNPVHNFFSLPIVPPRNGLLALESWFACQSVWLRWQVYCKGFLHWGMFAKSTGSMFLRSKKLKLGKDIEL